MIFLLSVSPGEVHDFYCPDPVLLQSFIPAHAAVICLQIFLCFSASTWMLHCYYVMSAYFN